MSDKSTSGIEQFCDDCGVVIYEMKYGDADGKHYLVPSYCPRCGCVLDAGTEQ